MSLPQERLYDAYYAASDPEKLFEAANVPSPFKKPDKDQAAPSPSKKPKEDQIPPTASTDCEICFLPLENDPSSEVAAAGLECGHLFCRACWAEYLSTKIVQDGVSLSIQCPDSGCRVLADDATGTTHM